MSEPRYYCADGTPSEIGIGRVHMQDAPSELARLQRERDEARASLRAWERRGKVLSLEVTPVLHGLRRWTLAWPSEQPMHRVLWRAVSERPYDTPESALDAAWDALAAAGLVTETEEGR